MFLDTPGDITADEPFHTPWGPSGYSPPAWLPVLPAHAAQLVIKHNSHLPAAPASRQTTGQEEKE